MNKLSGSTTKCLINAIEGKEELSLEEFEKFDKILGDRNARKLGSDFSKEDAEDANSDTYVGFLESYRKGKITDEIKDKPDWYFLRITRNVVIDKFNDGCRHRNTFESIDEVSEDKQNPVKSSEDEVAIKQLIEIIEQIIENSHSDKLNNGWLILKAIKLKGLSHGEISKELGLNEKSSKVYTHETCKFINQELAKRGISFSDYTDCFK